MKKLGFKPVFPKKQHIAISVLLASTLLISACSDSDDDPVTDTTPVSGEIAIVASVAADFTSGAHAVINTSDTTDLQENLAPTVSDITMAAYGDHFYRIERFARDNVTKFNVNAPADPVWQYSTLDAGDEVTGNPQTMVFLSETKAYILRAGKTTAWIVDPSATTQETFKTGEIDLSAYDDGDGAVEMSSGVIVDGKLFIAMQRLDDSFAPQDAYIAVIDTATDTEINTGTDTTFFGILSPVKNPGSIQADENGTVYVQGLGRFGSFDGSRPPEYTGGIATIDVETFETDLLVDDGDDNDHPHGQITGMQIVSTQRGYLVGYAGFGDNDLKAFNPITGVVEETVVSGLSGINIGGLAKDSLDQVWVSIGAGAESANITIIDSADSSVVGTPIALELNPTKVVFSQTSAQ